MGPIGARNRSGRSRKPDKEDEFFPDFSLDVVAERCVNLAPPADFQKIFTSPGAAPIVFAEHEPLHWSAVRDNPGLRDRRGDVTDAADDRAITQNAAQHVVLVDAVLERNHRSIAGNERLYKARGFFGVPQLYAEDHEIDSAELPWIVRRDDAFEMQVAELALDAQSVLAERLEHLPAGDESHVRAAFGKPSAKIAANTTGSHDRYSHPRSPLLFHDSLLNAYSLMGCQPAF